MPKKKLKIIYEDKTILVVNKEAGLLTIATKSEREKTLYHEVYEYLKSKNKHNKVYIVHRLDKDTSGLVLFAKNEDAKYKLQNNWSKVERRYYAVTEGVTKEKDVIRLHLMENNNFQVFVSKDGKLAITEYKRILNNKKYSLLDINLKTGRKNQIRISLSHLGYPIIGDKKYNAKTNPLNRLGLHAYKIVFNHPKTNEHIFLETSIPKTFKDMFECK